MFALAGCAVERQQQGSTAHPLGSAVPAISCFATELAAPSTFLAPMPTAVVVLKPDGLNRNRAFCNVFTRRLPTVEEARAASVVAPI